MRRLIPLLCVVVLTGCGVSAGVAAIESHTELAAASAPAAEVPAGDAPDDEPAAGLDLESADATDELELDAAELDRLSARFPPVDIVSDPPSSQQPRTVAVVGDSLTLASQRDISDALEAIGLDVVAVDGVVSRRMARSSTGIPSGVRAIEAISSNAAPELWVIALGTNDVGAGATATEFSDDMSRVLAALPADAAVIWVDLFIRDREAAIVRANGLIRAGLVGRPGLAAVVDWHAHGFESGVITGDGIHLTPAGQRLFAATIADAIGSVFAD
ncbi:MAG TPA: hypothetical protein VIS05_04720 [Ilumatobacter sp.]